MKKAGVGGGNKAPGTIFEYEIDRYLARMPGYSVARAKCKGEQRLLYNDRCVAYRGKKQAFCRHSENDGVVWKDVIGRRISPHVAPHVAPYVAPHAATHAATLREVRNTIDIVQTKDRKMAASADYRLATCAFEKRRYKKLPEAVEIGGVENIYILNRRYREYREGSCEGEDVFKSIEAVGRDDGFERSPFDSIGLPED